MSASATNENTSSFVAQYADQPILQVISRIQRTIFVGRINSPATNIEIISQRVLMQCATEAL